MEKSKPKVVSMVEIQKNSHKLTFATNHRRNEVKLAILSDLHWDNPDCDQKLLKKDLDYCLENDIHIMLNGDTFCLMQGKYDPRSSKSKVRPEHQKDDYLDAVIRTAVEFFKPYAELITVVGVGNHESGILRRHETDVLKRFVDMLNAVAKPKHLVYLGGYKGALTISNQRSGRNGDNYRILYFHGSGGGGVVTRGEINLTRMMAEFEGFDCYTMGHIHEKKSTVVSKLVISPMGSLNQKEILMTITGTYKDEYKLGKSGWHVERGAPPKPLGGMIVTIQFVQDAKTSRTVIHSFASAFPI